MDGLSASEDRPELRTVQQVVQRAVREAVRERVTLVGASRTDAGVHAWGQTASFTASDDRRGAPDERLAMAINARLPPDVLVRSCVRTRDDFHAISDCVAKSYRYTLHATRERPLWNRRLVHHIYLPLDEAAMREGAARFVGEHDFAAFATAGHGRESTVRRVFDCRIERPNDGELVEMHIVGNGFLWNMVRIIGGTLVDIGLGRKKPEDVTAAILSRDRRLAGPTLPARGLCLMWGLYPGDVPGQSQSPTEDAPA